MSKEPAQISLMDICQAMEDPLIKNECLLDLVGCSNGSLCNLHAFWIGEKARIVSHLQKTNLANLSKPSPEKNMEISG